MSPFSDAMINIRQAIRNIISERILPWIERDGVSKLILPEQITPDDCAKPMKCKQTCDLRHREHEIGIGLTGEVPYCIESKRFIFTPGRMVLLPAETPHASDVKTWSWAENLDLDRCSSSFWLRSFHSGIWAQFLQFTDLSDVLEVSRPCLLLDRHFSRLMVCLLEEVRSGLDNYAGVGRCILMEIMERCLRATGAAAADTLSIPTSRRRTKVGSKQPPSRVRIAREFIHSNYHRPIGRDDIVDAAESSITHLSRQFKAATGMSPIQYLTNIRMAAARELLATDLKVSEVARLVGIEDPAYFSRVFCHASGVTPLTYRERLAKASKSAKPRKVQ